MIQKRTPSLQLRFSAAWLLILAPMASLQAGITLNPIGTYETGIFARSAAEIVAHDPGTQRLFGVNVAATNIDVLDISDPTAPAKVDAIDLSSFGSAVTSVAVHGRVVAVSIQNTIKTDPGTVAFYDSSTLALFSSVTVGALPDMVIFTPNGQNLLVANEGEPSDDYLTDPEGSVSIIDVSGGAANVTQADVRTAGFTSFNNAVLDPSIRIFGPNATVAQDVEPEYIAVSADSTTAWVTLQENNAVATVDIASGAVTGLAGLGFKDHSVAGNGMDASDKDGAINITTWPVKGMYLPDAIAAYSVMGETYLVLANEGDSRDYDGFSEEARVAGLKLWPSAFAPGQTRSLQMPENLGRLKVTSTLGQFALPGDGDGKGNRKYSSLYSFGTRSFSIRTATGQLVFDSGDAIEQVTAFVLPDYFNSDSEENAFDNRSDDKGPEPENVTVAEVFGKTYAFIALERIGGVIIYDVSDPFHPSFVEYVNNRDFSVDPAVDLSGAGDLGPEGVIFISAADSPNGEPLLVLANEISGTTTIFEISETE